jgi:hypothetical protein
MKILEYKKKLNEVAQIPEAIKWFIPEESEESRLAKSEYKVSNPLIRVGIYAMSQESSFISDVMDYLDGLSKENDLSSYYTKRLECKELFRCLRLLENECLWNVLERIKGLSIADLGKLKNAILNNDIDVVWSIIYEKEVNIDPITPVCRLLYLKIRMDDLNKWLEESRQEIDSLPSEESDESCDIIIDFFLQYTSRYHDISKDLLIHKEKTPFSDISFENSQRIFLDDDFDVTGDPPSARDIIIHNLKKAYPSFIEDGFSLNEYADNEYMGVLGMYCKLKSVLPSLSTVAKVVMEGILKEEEFSPIWSRFEEFDDNTFDVLEKEHDDFLLKHGIPIDEDGSKEEEAPSTPQIEEQQPFFIKGTTENKDEKQFANMWPLPNDFFGPAYIDDDCPQNEYFPMFLKDLIQFEEQNGQSDEQYAELRKEGLVKLSHKFSKFIDDLASKNFIINDDDNKLALARALTGKRVESSVKKVKWGKPKTIGTKNAHINSLCFLIRWLYPKNISNLASKYEHVLTVFDGLGETKPAANAGVNVKKSPIKIVVKSFLDGLKECAPIVNNENLDLLMKEFEEKYGKN